MWKTCLNVWKNGGKHVEKQVEHMLNNVEKHAKTCGNHGENMLKHVESMGKTC